MGYDEGAGIEELTHLRVGEVLEASAVLPLEAGPADLHHDLLPQRGCEAVHLLEQGAVRGVVHADGYQYQNIPPWNSAPISFARSSHLTMKRSAKRLTMPAVPLT